MTDTIRIFDTTLRDGEQSPGCSMNLEEKLRVAAQLEALGVDIIEAGFAIASEGDFEAVTAVAKQCETAVVASLARAALGDIDRAWAAVRHAKQPRIHTFIATSPLHMRVKLNLTPEATLEAIRTSVSHARNLCADIEWSAEDATRTDPDFLCRAVEIAIAAGASTINLPDTVGYATPEPYGAMFRDVIKRVPNADKAVFSTHCHNDLGMATANSLAAVEAGARQVECTINGLGERAGNTALEEVVMAMRVRNDILPYRTQIDALRALTDVDRAKVDVYRAQLGALETRANIYRTQVQTIVERASLEKLKVDLFRTRVEAYVATVQGKRAEYDGYNAAINGQEALVRIYGTQVDAYKAELDGFRAKIDAQAATIRAQAQTNDALATRYRAELDAYSTVVDARGKKANVELDIQRAELNAFEAQARTTLETVRLQATVYESNARIILQNTQLEVETLIKNAQMVVERAKTIADLGVASARVYEGMAGAALSGMNTLVASTLAE